MIAQVLGGIGIFLIGMILMTDGLKSLGGDALRRALTRFTGGTVQSIISGFAVTSLVQASSATILATIGFVSAGLITFTQAIAIVFGANLGTTTIGWLVSLLGFKFHVELIAMPMAGIGALMMLLARGRKVSAGMVIAGFGLLFIGIATLQSGMKHLTDNVDITTFPDAGWYGRVVLIAVGILMTILMQSSTAALVTTLAALYTGNLTLAQAAALVIGQSIGKTSTAVIATIGASVQARRAALVHIIFNCVTGFVVYFLFAPFLNTTTWLCSLAGIHDPSVALSGFFTLYNLFGIVLLSPFISHIGALIERYIPERGSALTRNLDDSVTKVAPVAVETARRTVIGIAALVMGSLRRLVLAEVTYRDIADDIEGAQTALAETGRFLGKVSSESASAEVHHQHISVLHAIDHLERLTDACKEIEEVRTVAHIEELRAIALEKLDQLDDVVKWLQGRSFEPPVRIVEAMSRSIAGIRQTQRVEVLELTARGGIDPNLAMGKLEAMRWLDRLVYHIWRAVYHLGDRLQEQVQLPRDRR